MNMMSDSKIDSSNLKSRTLKNHFSHFSHINSKFEEDVILKCADLQEQLFVYEDAEILSNRSNENNNKNLKKNLKAVDNPLMSISRSPKLLSNKDEIKNRNFSHNFGACPSAAGDNLNMKADLVKAVKGFDYHLLEEFDDKKIFELMNSYNNINDNQNNNVSDFSKKKKDFLFGKKDFQNILRKDHQ